MYHHFWSRVEMVQEGVEPLPHCDLFEMHMSVWRIFKHQIKMHCDNKT